VGSVPRVAVVAWPRRKLIAFITDPPVVRRILGYLKLPTEAPAIAPARSPPQMDFEF